MDKRPDDPTQNGGNNKWTKGGRGDGLIGAMDMGFNSWATSGCDFASVRHVGEIQPTLLGFMQHGRRNNQSSLYLEHTSYASSMALPLFPLLRASLPLTHCLLDLP